LLRDRAQATSKGPVSQKPRRRAGLRRCRRRVKTGPPAPGEKWATWGRPGGLRAWVRLRRASLGGPGWSGWSSGPRSVGCTSSRGCRSGRSAGGQGCIATRSARRSTAASRRSIGGRRRARSWIRSRRRSTGCWATIPSCRGFGSASCWGRWAAGRPRRWSMTTCGRFGRCSRRRPGPFSAPSIGRASLFSSMSGSPAARSRSATARPGRGWSSSRARASPAPAPGCWCSAPRPRTCASPHRERA
jgi:hypothetical protein